MATLSRIKRSTWSDRKRLRNKLRRRLRKTSLKNSSGSYARFVIDPSAQLNAEAHAAVLSTNYVLKSIGRAPRSQA